MSECHLLVVPTDFFPLITKVVSFMRSTILGIISENPLHRGEDLREVMRVPCIDPSAGKFQCVFMRYHAYSLPRRV